MCFKWCAFGDKNEVFYLKICVCQKNVVPLQRDYSMHEEKVNIILFNPN